MEYKQEEAEAREILRFLLIALLRESMKLERIRTIFLPEENAL